MIFCLTYLLFTIVHGLSRHKRTSLCKGSRRLIMLWCVFQKWVSCAAAIICAVAGHQTLTTCFFVLFVEVGLSMSRALVKYSSRYLPLDLYYAHRLCITRLGFAKVGNCEVGIVWKLLLVWIKFVHLKYVALYAGSVSFGMLLPAKVHWP